MPYFDIIFSPRYLYVGLEWWFHRETQVFNTSDTITSTWSVISRNYLKFLICPLPCILITVGFTWTSTTK